MRSLALQARSTQEETLRRLLFRRPLRDQFRGRDLTANGMRALWSGFLGVQLFGEALDDGRGQSEESAFLTGWSCWDVARLEGAAVLYHQGE